MYSHFSARAYVRAFETKQIKKPPRVYSPGVLLCLVWVVCGGLRGAFLCVSGIFLPLPPYVALWGLYEVVVWVVLVVFVYSVEVYAKYNQD